MINKKIGFFSAMLSHPEGRGRATLIFWQKLKFGIFQNSVCME